MIRVFAICLLHLILPMQGISQQTFLLAGQSNATGQGDKLASNSLYHSRNAFEYDVILDSIKGLQDPSGQKWKDLEPANSGSILPAFAFSLTQNTKKPVVVITAARGGSSCHQKAELSNYGTWDQSGNLFQQAQEKVNAALKFTKSNLSGIIWMQGERDANAINDGIMNAENYKHALVSLISRFRKEFGENIPFFIIQTGYQSGRPKFGNDQVRAMQTLVSKEIPRVFIAYDKTSQFMEQNRMKDHVHYNQTGLNEIGIEVGNFVSTVLR